jgi:hypothetical protein
MRRPCTRIQDQRRLEELRREAEHAILAEDMLSGDELIALLASPPPEGALIRSRSPMGVRVPAFQVDQARSRVHAVVAGVNVLLGAGDDPWGFAGFWFGLDAHLGARPADLVPDPARHEEIRQAAAREAAPIE